VNVLEVEKDGNLSLVSGSPFGSAGVSGTALVKRGKRQFVYAAEYEASQLRGFEVLASGGLGELGSSPITGFDGPTGMRDRGALLFVSNDSSDEVASFVVGSGGELVPAPGTPPVVDQTFNVAPDPKGKFVYEPAGDAPEIHGFRVDRASAALAPLAGNPLDSGLPSYAAGLAVGRRVLVAVESAFDQPKSLRAHRRARDGSLTPLGAPRRPRPG
jgi:6-phosphogluconolactonase (cycloisomerase 2 family)